MSLDNQAIEQIVKEAGSIDEKKLAEAKETASQMGKSLEQVLSEKNLINEKDLAQLISNYFGVNFVDLRDIKIPKEVLKYVPEELARSSKAVPYELSDDDSTLYLAMSDPKDLSVIDSVRKETGLNVEPAYTTSQSLKEGLTQYRRDIKQEFARIIKETTAKETIEEDELRELAEEVPVVKALETILAHAVAEKASDVHIERMENQIMIRFRVDGILRDVINLPLEMHSALVARVKILGNLKIDEHRQPQDGRFKFDAKDDTVALRVSIIPAFRGENVVLRLLEESARPMSLSELGFEGRNKKVIEEVIKQPNGMVLSTGPTGSGKTTTLYSILNIINTPEVKICTIEDPVEYEISRVNQMQIHPKSGLTFAKGLRSLLRHDPDNMMVGEIRDKETAEIAIHSALTGHLVLSTLHTNSAPSAIPRLLDMEVEPYLVSSTFNVIIAQRLVRNICQSCTKEFKPKAKLIKQIADNVSEKKHEELKGKKFYKGEGCKRCNGTGYKGRSGIYEVLQNSSQISDLIIEKASADRITQAAKKDGFTTMFEDGLNKALSGKTTLEEVLRAVKLDKIG